ncbi:MAG: hypothetical protein WCO45_15420 [Pseudanabaena sp. ELA607]
MQTHLGRIPLSILLILWGLLCLTDENSLRAEVSTLPKSLPTLNLQDLPANLFQVAACAPDLADSSRNLEINRQRSNSEQPLESVTFCFTRINPIQDEFIIGTILHYPHHLRSLTNGTAENSSKKRNGVTLDLDNQVLVSILDEINLRYHNPFTWVNWESSRIDDLGDGGYSLYAQGNSRNGTYQHFQIIVFSRQDILVILVTSYSSITAPVINIIELARGLDQRLTKWLIS